MIKTILDSVWAGRIARILLGAIFIYASIDKLLHPLEFARIIDAYRILPENLVIVVAAILPFLELICGILLIAGVWVVPSLIWIGLLLIVFVAGMVQAHFRGLAIDCGCFSVTGENSGITAWTILRDGLILLLWAGTLRHFARRKR
jgi:uncharacterized membrane protein YphA (DoxX/SURF4 family)